MTGSLADKTAVILSLPLEDEMDSFTAALPETALHFVADNMPVVGNVPGMKELAAAAIPMLSIQSPEHADLLWDMFEFFGDDIIKTSVLSSFFEIVPSNKQFVLPYLGNLHTFVAECIASSSYSAPACIQAVKLMGVIGDLSSFDLLFRIVYGKYDATLTEEATVALNSVLPVSQINLAKVMESESVSMAEKKLLFSIVQKNQEISPFLKADLAEKALSATIINTEDVSGISAVAVDLQLAAIGEIESSSWTRASATVAKFFPQAQKEFECGLISEPEFIGIIACLEKLATTQSVAALLDYLSALNSLMATADGVCNIPTTVAVINALGALGDKTAFDNLLYVTYLPYPEPVVAAARNALAGLKW